MRLRRPSAPLAPASTGLTTLALLFVLVSLAASALLVSCARVDAAPLASEPAATPLLAGYERGLYRLGPDGVETPLWIEGEVRKILRVPSGYWFLSSRGPLWSADLVDFEVRAKGLPIKLLKTWDGKTKSFLRELAELKDLEVDPADPRRLVACTKDEIWLSADSGLSWTRISGPSASSGLKAVALLPGAAPLLFASHAVDGLFVLRLGADGTPPAKPVWEKASGELNPAPGAAAHDEIADIAVRANATGFEVWAANTFRRTLYQYDLAARSFVRVHSDGADFSEVDSLAPGLSGLRYVARGEIRRFDPAAGRDESESLLTAAVRASARERLGALDCVLLRDAAGAELALSELWLVTPRPRSAQTQATEGRHGIYLRTGYVAKAGDRAAFFDLMAARGLDSLVVDLKDDEGRLRFTPRDPRVRDKARIQAPIDVEAFTAEAKARGIWLVARIVVFKDKALHEAAAGALAVWDPKAGAPWRGYEIVAAAAPEPGAGARSGASAAPTAPPERRYYGEYWVDPYSELVWEYNVAIANELIDRGFDEIQFDYIRFPTDGVNLADAQYRFRDAGMDRESALASFLRYASEEVHGPIGIDIYGANGWYRSGARTGQDLELLARYVDVVSPMHYPSHFAQGFLAHEPAELRPYRIYYLGSLRGRTIARDRVVIRPYVQAFYLDVAYDRAFYGARYVELEIMGVRDGANQGLTFWNNVARYDEVPALRTDGERRLEAGPRPGRGD